jgi:hypothetical protein
MTNGSGKLSTWVDYTYSNFLAGESMVTGSALYVSNGTSTVNLYSGGIAESSDSFNPTSSVFIGQTFTTGASTQKITRITANVQETWAGNSWTGSIKIYATSGGVPTGGALYTGTFSTGVGSSQVADVYPNLSVSTGTMYAFVINADDYSATKVTGAKKSSSFYSGGTWIKTTNGGGAWTTSTYDLDSAVYTQDGVGGGIYKTSASTAIDKANNFIGFSSATVNTSTNVGVITTGIANVFTGLTVGATYYLSDTAGVVSTSAGSQSRKIGLSVSSTAILIKYDNP